VLERLIHVEEACGMYNPPMTLAAQARLHVQTMLRAATTNLSPRDNSVGRLEGGLLSFFSASLLCGSQHTDV
jgi:hypothetical protein